MKTSRRGGGSMTNAERAANLARIATSAVAIERSHGIPAELGAGQCVIESSWLAKAPGNNCFGIKASPLKPYQWLTTTERLTPVQLAAERAKGKVIKSVGPMDGTGKCAVVMEDAFAIYPSLTRCFEAYAELLVTGKYFKARFDRFKAHGDVLNLLTDMSGVDGLPPYFTGSGYVKLWQSIVNQQNVKAALQLARAAASMTV